MSIVLVVRLHPPTVYLGFSHPLCGAPVVSSKPDNALGDSSQLTIGA
jgi:hypothetical protein